MEICRIAFIGHREIYNAKTICDKLDEIIKDRLRHEEYVEFLMGRNGDFDIFAASAVKKAQKALGHENNCLILVEPYPMKDDEYYKKYYDEIQYPLDRSTHPKSAITKRNRWLVENADMLIAYVEEGKNGGAMTVLKYAERLDVKIINLAKKD
ncbi:MAG: hypothetical protein J6Q78_03310 [Clostridia bacterium]|nr:hypothetical protein [Clostridia bacterium]